MSTIWKHKKVLITGGASGIGKIMGRIVLEKGAELIIWDVNEDHLKSTKEELSKLGKVSTYIVDISERVQISSVAKKVKEDHKAIDFLINDAGIIVGKMFWQHSEEEIMRTMEINTFAPMLVTKEFLDGMLERNSGYICNISSLAGMISNPKMSIYVASKWALAGWSDSLRLELKSQKRNIFVTTILPYYINTGMFDGVKSSLPILDQEKTAEKIIKAIENKKTMYGIPLKFFMVRLMQGVLNVRGFDWLVGKQMGIYKTMDDFTGRKSDEK